MIKVYEINKIHKKILATLLASTLVIATVMGSLPMPAFGDEFTASGHLVRLGSDVEQETKVLEGPTILADNGIMGTVFGIEATFDVARIQGYDPVTHAKISEFFVPCPDPPGEDPPSCNGRGLAFDGVNFWYSILTGGLSFTGDGLIHKIGMSGGADILTISDGYGAGGRGIGAIDFIPGSTDMLVISYLPDNDTNGTPNLAGCIADDTNCLEEVRRLDTSGTTLGRCDIPFNNSGGTGVGTETLVVTASGTTFYADGGEADLMFIDEYKVPTSITAAGTLCDFVQNFSSTPVGIGGLDFDLAGQLVVSSTFATGIGNLDGSPYSSLVGGTFTTDTNIEDITIKTDRCTQRPPAEDPISMNTVRNQNTVKTIHAEKHVFDCLLDQGDLPVIVDVTIFAEIFEDMKTQSVIKKQALVVTCTKDKSTVTAIKCESSTPSTQPPVPLRNCIEEPITHPQEMNTVNKGSIVKTIEAQKEVFMCNLGNGTIKKVDLVLFTEIWENLNNLPNDPIIKKAFESMRCVILNGTTEVETCQFLKVYD